MDILYTPIGTVHTPYKDPAGAPIQPLASQGAEGRIEIFPEYVEGLADLEGFSHIILLCHFHRASAYSLRVKPFLDNQLRGLFSCRAPARPNPIGLSIVRLVRVEGATLHIRDVDIVDGTPLLDIKPYVPTFDECDAEVRVGWLEPHLSRARDTRADARFQTSDTAHT